MARHRSWRVWRCSCCTRRKRSHECRRAAPARELPAASSRLVEGSTMAFRVATRRGRALRARASPPLAGRPGGKARSAKGAPMSFNAHRRLPNVGKSITR
jgi:hypothetical protein